MTGVTIPARPARLVPDLPPEGRSAVRGGVVGNYVDQVAIFVPVLALAPALPTLAGPHARASSAAVVVMATLLGRPIGSMIFGRLSDRWGRTSTTQVAIAGTAACSLLLAAVPDHTVLGAGTIAVLVLLRFVGGIFLAGEYTSAIPLAMEWSKPRRRGLVSGLIMSMAPWAQSSIAFATAGLLAVLGRESYASWGWRLPFVVSGLASLALLHYYRSRVADAVPPARRTKGESPGLRSVLAGQHARAFWQVFGLMSGLWVMTNLVVVVLSQRLGAASGLGVGAVAVAMGVASIAQALVMSVTGHLSTLLGRRRFFLVWGALAAVAAPPLWLLVTGHHGLPVIALAAAGLQVVTVTAYGPVGAYVNERFPASVRATAYGSAYSLSIVVPALYPFWLPVVEEGLGDATIPLLLGLGGVLVAGFGWLGPRLSPRDLDAPVETVATAPPITGPAPTHP